MLTFKVMQHRLDIIYELELEGKAWFEEI